MGPTNIRMDILDRLSTSNVMHEYHKHRDVRLNKLDDSVKSEITSQLPICGHIFPSLTNGGFGVVGVTR